MRSWSRIAAMGPLVCLALAACGGSAPKASEAPASLQPASPAALVSPPYSPSPSPTTSYKLVALPSPPSLPKTFASIDEMSPNIALNGKWRTSSFQPAFSFVAPKLAFPFTARVDVPDFVYLTSEDPKAVAFVRPSGVFQHGTDPASLPKDLVSWLRSNPFLHSGAASDVVVGGLKGTQFDAVVTSLPEQQPADCADDGIKCLPIAFDSDGVLLYLPGEKVRFIVLDVGDGPPLVITIEAFPNGFGIFAKDAERLVNSVEFASASG